MSCIYISEKPKVLLVSCESFAYSYKISDDGEIPAFVSSKMGLLDVDIIYYDRQKIKTSDKHLLRKFCQSVATFALLVS